MPCITKRWMAYSTSVHDAKPRMSKGQRGNKEAKKPKKAPVPVQPVSPAGAQASVNVAPAECGRRR